MTPLSPAPPMGRYERVRDTYTLNLSKDKIYNELFASKMRL